LIFLKKVYNKIIIFIYKGRDLIQKNVENKKLNKIKNKIKMNKQKGFTIIELIVVIAIIAVLAAIVLVNVTQYIAKGKDSAIKGNMSSMATIAAAFYDNNSSMFLDSATPHVIDLSTDAAFAAGKAAIEDSNGPANNVNSSRIATAWCVQSALNEAGKYWCVDNTGYKGDTGNATSCDTDTADCAAD